MANLNKCIPKAIASEMKTKMNAQAKKKLSPEKLREDITKIIDEKYGLNLSKKQSTEIIKLSTVVKEAKDKLGDNFGSLNHEKEMIEFFKAENAMNRYLKALDPSSDLAVLTGTIGRAAMLTSIKSPLINISSNIENTLVEGLVRRLTTGQVTAGNKSIASKYFKMANKIYDETGVDISRMRDIGDLGIGGQRVLGKDTISAVGPGKIKKVGRFAEDVVFKNMMGKPDSLTANYNFIDSVLLNSKKYAKNGRKVSDIAEDAILLNPKTSQGKIIRNQAVLDAQISTFTQRTKFSGFTEGVRNVLNKASGDARLGDWFMPFVKTPANIISIGTDYAGMGVFKGLYKLGVGIKKGTLQDPGVVGELAADLVRGGVGTTAGFALSLLFDEEDFVGAYDPRRMQIEQLKNSTYNAVKIGNRWVNIEYLGPLSIPVTAALYAKRGKGFIEKTLQYTRGLKSSIAELPGIDFIDETITGLKSTKDKAIKERVLDLSKDVVNQASSRLIPSIVNDIAKATDKYYRDTAGTFGSLKSKIPGVRQTLPIKETVFGEPRTTEGPISTILFGSRVSKDKSTPIIKEVDRVLKATGKKTSFTDWSRTTSKKVAKFKERVGEEKFNEAKTDYGVELQKQLERLFKNPQYNLMSDEEKLTQISNQDAQAQEIIFRKYGFKYVQDRSTKKTIKL